MKGNTPFTSSPKARGALDTFPSPDQNMASPPSLPHKGVPHSPVPLMKRIQYPKTPVYNANLQKALPRSMVPFSQGLAVRMSVPSHPPAPELQLLCKAEPSPAKVEPSTRCTNSMLCTRHKQGPIVHSAQMDQKLKGTSEVR